MRKKVALVCALVFATAAVAGTTAGSASAIPTFTFELLLAQLTCTGEGPTFISDAWLEGDDVCEDWDSESRAVCINGKDYLFKGSLGTEDEDLAYFSEFAFEEFGVVVMRGNCANAPEPQQPDRYVYCAAAGNTDAAGNPLGVGQTLNLAWGEPNANKHFTGATLGFWVKSIGLTCQLTPEQAALAAASTVKVNHTGAPNTQEGAQIYTFVNA